VQNGEYQAAAGSAAAATATSTSSAEGTCLFIEGTVWWGPSSSRWAGEECRWVGKPDFNNYKQATPTVVVSAYFMPIKTI